MNKEVIKANEVNAAYLFLGIGGCGSSIVEGVAKQCHKDERENISFVCMDTDVNDLKRIKDELKYVYTIQTSTPQTVGSFLDNDDDARKNWFPKSATMYNKTMSEGAGQVRAISRLALNATIKTGRIKPLYDAIDVLFQKSGKEMKQSMRLIIASSTSGGTGSGMILPISMLVRDYVNTKYPNASLLIRAMLLLPETLDSVIDSQTERDSQARNGYSTIKELNAFMMKGSGFVDLDPDLKQYMDLAVKVPIAGSDKLRTLSNLPIDFCFLMDGQDSEDSTLTGYSQYKKAASIALYEQNIGPMSRKSTSTEDNIIKELAKAKGRNRFGGIGAGIIRYPHDEIIDYIACDMAIDSIGNNGKSAWTQYDKAQKVEESKQKSQGVPETQIKKINEKYLDLVRSSKDGFSKNMVNAYGLENIEPEIKNYISVLTKYVQNMVTGNSEFETIYNAAKAQSGEVDYDQTSVMEVYNPISAYYEAVNKQDKNLIHELYRSAERYTEGVFGNTDEKSENYQQSETYSVSRLISTATSVMHPCAARCALYQTQNDLARMYQESLKQRARISGELDKMLYEKPISITKLKNREVMGIVEFVQIETQKKPALKEIHETALEVFPALFKKIDEYKKTLIECGVYSAALHYVTVYSKEYEKFFDTFEKKTRQLEKRKENILESIKYHKGDAILNVCSKAEVLDELSKQIRSNGANTSDLLTSEINGRIFDQIKKNAIAEIEKEGVDEDLLVENKRVDIFDGVLMEYFKEQVSENDAKCALDIQGVNANIIGAIAQEYILTEAKKCKEIGKDFNYSADDVKAYIRTALETGKRIAAPSIQRMPNVEPREISRSACASGLLDSDIAKKYNVKDLFEKCDETETVSQYEMRFFNALYNVTPDKLKKFAAPYETETGEKEGGVYFKAYRAYSKSIGPDSTKNSAMSTHCDKRWDNIKKMPELDEKYQKVVVRNILKAFIYGIIHGAIQHKPLSNKTHGKSVYTYYNSEDRYEELIVPNGTLCDEFYEILDSLYVNAKVVEDINEVIKVRKRAVSIMKNCNYEGTEFFKDMAKFNIVKFFTGDTIREKSGLELEETIKKIQKSASEISKYEEQIKEAKDSESRRIATDKRNEYYEREDTVLVENESSLFTIPMVYYYSLPNNARLIGELTDMVDAVIDVFREEYKTWEKECDCKFVLCTRLINELELLKIQYQSYLNEVPEMKLPPINENEVIDIIQRRIKDVIRSAPEPEDYELLLDEVARQTGECKA